LLASLFGNKPQAGRPGSAGVPPACRVGVHTLACLWNKLKLELQLAAETAALPGLPSDFQSPIASPRYFLWTPRWDGNQVEAVKSDSPFNPARQHFGRITEMRSKCSGLKKATQSGQPQYSQDKTYLIVPASNNISRATFHLSILERTALLKELCLSVAKFP